MSQEHFRTVTNLIREAEATGVLHQPRDVSGYSGERLIGALQRIAKYQETRGAGGYLEIGVFQGLTLISVASVLEKTPACGVDNFAQLDPGNINEKLVRNRAAANDLTNVKIINADYEDALEDLKRHIGDSKIGTYFVDGPHDYRSQLVCLQLIRPYLSEFAVILVDDSNYRHVRLANRDFLLQNPEFKLLFESYTECHPANMNKATEQEARKGWWNGVNIIVHDPENRLKAMMPPTLRTRELFYNEHIVQSARYSFLAPEALFIVQTLLSCRLFRFSLQLFRIIKKLRHANRELVGTFRAANTFSEDLPESNFNSAVL